ncbi:unnamed protein product [Heterobilharzia americana]|nr:unnamed protein product [Heterobilharzia americana]
MIWSWEYITKLLVPCEILIITKLLFCFITFPNNLSLYTILSIIIKTIFSSPITVFSLFLFINWFTYYAYLVYFIIISSSSIYSDVYKLIHFGITYQVPFTLDNIELFIYTYTSTLYFLELLNIDECIYDINCCLLLFISFRLYSYLNCWQILRLSNKFYTNLLDTHLFSFLTFYKLFPIHTTTFLSSEYCSLCILPLYRPIILSSSLTYNSTSECQHLLHVSCATIAKLISFPCLRCSEESFIFIQGKLYIVLHWSCVLFHIRLIFIMN